MHLQKLAPKHTSCLPLPRASCWPSPLLTPPPHRPQPHQTPLLYQTWPSTQELWPLAAAFELPMPCSVRRGHGKGLGARTPEFHGAPASGWVPRRCLPPNPRPCLSFPKTYRVRAAVLSGLGNVGGDGGGLADHHGGGRLPRAGRGARGRSLVTQAVGAQLGMAPQVLGRLVLGVRERRVQGGWREWEAELGNTGSRCPLLVRVESARGRARKGLGEEPARNRGGASKRWNQ